MGEFLDFLAQWPYRKASDDLILLGLPLFWWNRIGGIIQFIGGSFIVAEIIGLEKISKTSFRVAYLIAFILILLPVSVILLNIAEYLPKEKKELSEDFAALFTSWAFIIYVIVGSAASFGTILMTRKIIRISRSPNIEKTLQIISIIFVFFGAFLQLLAA